MPRNIIVNKKKSVKKITPSIQSIFANIEKPRENRITSEAKTHIKKFGQYWTTEPILQQKICEFIKNNPTTILEPSCGRGDLVSAVKKVFPNIQWNLYEIDPDLEFKINQDNINFCDFLQQNIQQTFKTIVGNPPFVKIKKSNLAIQFTKKCFQLLQPNGELIFIVPADFFKLTNVKDLMLEMMEVGCFTHIYHPDSENMFCRASVNVCVFRYQKTVGLVKKCLYNGVEKRVINLDGMLMFLEEGQSVRMIGDYFDIYVGMVSGKEDIYKNAIGNIDIITGKDCKERYIFPKQYPTENAQIDQHLLENKQALLDRQIRKFHEDNWWEWGAPRNVGIMEQQKDTDCIYVHTLTRKEEVAFKGKTDYFSGNLLMMIPKIEFSETGKTMEEVVEWINGEQFKRQFMYAGRFKIGHRQLGTTLFL